MLLMDILLVFDLVGKCGIGWNKEMLELVPGFKMGGKGSN